MEKREKKKRRKGVIILVLLGLTLGLGALTGWLGAGAARERPIPEPMTGDCMMAGCHDVAGKEAKMYVAADQEVLRPGVPVVAAADTSMELDFYFEGIVGVKKQMPVIGWLISPQPYEAVGIELVVDPSWDVKVGTEAGPAGWSRSWQRGGSGGGEWRNTSWQPVEGAAGRYYLDFRNSSWRTHGDLPALAADGGNQTPADLDGVADRMGADAAIWIPPETVLGRYEIVVGGVGHDEEGQRAHVSWTVPVEVVPADYAEPAPAPPDGQRFYATLCSSCHLDTAEDKGRLLRRGAERVAWVINWGTGDMRPVRGMDEDEIAAVIDYIRTGSGPIDVLVPFVPHLVEGQLCLTCHGAEAVRPYPASHTSFGQLQCSSCHRISPIVLAADTPQVPHPGSGRICLECHETGGLVPVTATHEGRDNDLCLVCHEVVPAMAGAAVPLAPHRVGPDRACSSCHGFEGMRPMPQDHEGRKDALCIACHDADTAVIGSIPLMPHVYEGREACLACHSPAGWKPAPTDHWDRTEETCVVCHQ